MARGRYCVSITEAGKDDFVYTFYCFAPAFFLARNPTHEEKLAFANQLVARYNPRALDMKSLGCVTCGRPAHKSVDWLTYALRDPGCLAVNNTLLPVCQAASCARKAQRGLDLYRKDPSLHQGVVKLGPEIVSCRTCFKDFSGKVPLRACSRCNATLYCSPECQKINWKWHKQQCTGRVEAAKLTAEQLEQLDTILLLGSGGTMELPQDYHPGKLPVEQAEAGLGEMLECGQDAAIARNAKNAKLTRQKQKKFAKLGPAAVPIAVTPQQKIELEGACSDIFKYFGMRTSDMLLFTPDSA
ncbi:hypothetical protein MMC16_007866 [Acarospora aff. strigata]|nr:hypothetical protein [Acarospora aff. strigata]